MIFASGLGIVLSLVFGCLLLALIAELYYLLWWKKLRPNPNSSIDDSSKELFYLFCWNKPQNPIPATTTAAAPTSNRRHPEPQQEPLDVEAGPTKEYLLKDQDALVEAELMRLQNRLLFTIKEETKEDLESEDGRSKASRKGSRTRSLSDLVLAVDSAPLDCYSHHGFNPLFESNLAEAELNRLRSSPPPKFKFLRDAEEKLYKKLLAEAGKMGKVGSLEDANGGFRSWAEEEDYRDGSFIRIIVGKNNSSNQSSSQVLPLASSPSPVTNSVHKA